MQPYEMDVVKVIAIIAAVAVLGLTTPLVWTWIGNVFNGKV